ncbi:ataxin-3-like isoform X2 [Amphiura filiformis]
MDDSGYFSVQVISKALRVWGLELIPFGSSDAIAATIHPEKESAFICNFKDHWLTIRKLGYQWFNLNSLLTGPELISDTYLSMFITQLQREGYSIFVIRGKLPDNEADQVLRLMPAVQTQRPTSLAERNQQQQRPTSSAGASTSSSNIVSLGDLQSALEANKTFMSGGSGRSGGSSQDVQLQDAIKLSMQGVSGGSSSGEPAEPVDVEQLRQKRQAFFERQQQTQQGASSSASASSSQNDQELKDKQTVEHNSTPVPLPSRKPVPKPAACSNAAANFVGGEDESEHYENDEQVTEEAMLEAAIRMSMQSQEKR